MRTFRAVAVGRSGMTTHADWPGGVRVLADTRPATVDADPLGALETLAAHLDRAVLVATLTTGHGRLPHLLVASRDSGRLSERIYAGLGSYWWSWAERIGPVADPAAVAAKIGRVLRTLPQPAHE